MTLIPDEVFRLDRNDAIREWFELYGNHIYRFLLYFTDNSVDVDDLLQDTFARAYGAYHQFSGGNPKAWLLRIARNAAVDYIRKQGIDKRTDNTVLVTMSSPTQTPEEWTIAVEETRWMLKSLDAVNHNFAQVLLVRGVQDLSSREAAKVLGWSVSKVNVTYHRALKAARQILLQSDQ